MPFIGHWYEPVVKSLCNLQTIQLCRTALQTKLFVPTIVRICRREFHNNQKLFQFSYQDPSSVMGGASLMSGNSLR